MQQPPPPASTLTQHSPVLLQLYQAIQEDIRFHRNHLFRLEQRAYNIENEIISILQHRRTIPATTTPTTPTPTGEDNPSTTPTTTQPSIFATGPRRTPHRRRPTATESSEPYLSLGGGGGGGSIAWRSALAQVETSSLSSPSATEPSIGTEGRRRTTATERSDPFQALRRESEQLNAETAAFLSATEPSNTSMTYIGTFDVPLGTEGLDTTSFARSLLTRGSGLLSSASLGHLQGGGEASPFASATNLSDPSAFLLYFMMENMADEGTEPHGIPEEDLLTYLTDKVFEEIESPPNTCCPIRMDVFTPQSEVSEINKCKHVFCRQEIRTWLRTHHTCPLCRTAIDVVE